VLGYIKLYQLQRLLAVALFGYMRNLYQLLKL